MNNELNKFNSLFIFASSFLDIFKLREKPLSKTPPKVAGPPPATTFLSITLSLMNKAQTVQLLVQQRLISNWPKVR